MHNFELVFLCNYFVQIPSCGSVSTSTTSVAAIDECASEFPINYTNHNVPAVYEKCFY